jgi:hypothetical protein
VEVGVSARRLALGGDEALQLAGVVAAIVLAAVVNVLSARHFARWDWTADRRWSLSPATLETLRGLEQPVEVWAIAGPGDPLEPGLRTVLLSYQAASSRVDVRWIDPDRDTVQLVDVQRRFGIEAGKTVDGRVATDAVVVVASGDRHWFLTARDMFDQPDEIHARPREERALTQAIRSVLAGERARLCFTVGHGELSIEPGKDDHEFLGALRDLLEKNNYDLASVDTTAPGAQEPYAGCTGVVVAGPRGPFSPDEATRLRAWLLLGGNLLAAVGPVDGDSPTGMVPSGLDDVLAPFGIGLDDVLVHDVDPGLAVPETHGEGFFVTARPHPVTASLVGGGDAHPPRVAMFFARALRRVPAADAVAAADLLVTSGGAYGKRSIVGASRWADAPAREAGDPSGPFVLAMASERQRLSPAAGHGPRVVVVGSRFALAEDNWRQPRPLHGAAFFVDSALSWLVARPQVVDVPDKAQVAAGMRVSEQGRDEVRRYVLVLMPLAALLMAAAVWSWRRSSEGKPYVPRAGGVAPRAGSP